MNNTYFKLTLLFLIFVGIISIAFYSFHSSVQAATKETEIQDLTRSLESLNSASTKDESKLKEVATQRKQLLVETAKTDPALFLQLTANSAQKNNYPSSVQSELEETIQQDGELVVVHLDGKKGTNTSKTDYKFISGTDKKVYDLHFASGAPELQTGSKVKVKAVKIDSQMVVEAPQQNATTSFQTTQVAATPTFGEEKTAVILVNFANDASTPVTPAEMDSLIFTDTHSINEYYKENSFDQTFLSGQVYGWFTLSQTNDFCEDNYYNWSAEADSKATTSGVQLSSYSRILYVFPDVPNCSFGGLGTIGGTPGRSWILADQHDSRVYSHEFGHNLGIHHANSLDCGTKTIDVPANCTEEEYGDHFDVMGNYWYVTPQNLHFNAAHKMAVGWIPSVRVQNVTAPGTYKIYSIETSNTLAQAMKVPKQDTNESYIVSFRQATGFDAGLSSTNQTRGASIHVWNNDPVRQTRLLDMIGNTPDFDDATMIDGKTYVDNINGLRIIQRSHTPEYVEIQVRFVNQTPTVTPTPTPVSDTTIPTVKITSPITGSTVARNTNITVKANSSDNVGVTKVEFKRNGTIVCTDTVSPYACSMFTHATAKTSIDYTAKAYDAAGNVKSNKVTVITK